MKLHTKLAGLFAFSALATSVNATNLYQTPLTASDTGDYIIKINLSGIGAKALVQQISADQVSTLSADAGSKMVVASLDFEQAQKLASHAAVSYIEPDNYQSFYGAALPNEQLTEGFNLDEDDEYSDEFYASSLEILESLATTEHTPYGVSLVNADKVPEPAFANKTVCIIDSGLQVDHGDFDGLPVSGNHSDYSGFWNIDQVQHGTHVAGTIAAVENGRGVVGVIKNGNINVYVQKLSNGAPGNRIRISHEIEAMEVCANQGADVVSMSFGGATPYNALNEVIDRLSERGVLFVAAAGNHGRKVSQRICDRQPTPEAKYACENAHKAKHFPASYHNVMSVANINAKKQKASSSPINDAIEVAAPGTQVLSASAKSYEIFSLKVNNVAKAVAHIGNTSTDFPEGPMLGAACGAGICTDPGGTWFEGKACLYQFDFRNFDLTTPANNCAANGGTMLVMYPPIPGMGPIRGSFGSAFPFPIFSIGNSTALDLLNNPEKSMDLSFFTSHHKFLSGTSMATPHVSGVAAKVWSLNEQCTNRQIRKVLQHTANDLGTEGKDIQFGFGLVDTQAAHEYIQANGCDIPTPACPDAWYWNQAYNGGDRVTFEGDIYKAKWWSKRAGPADSGPWEKVGVCK
ncbi:MAG: S8 family serine peptidase [Algicola sp.]|nr:S8 family serine peptidase [Algicola sp.]